MDSSTAAGSIPPDYELRFRSMRYAGVDFVFPCDVRGQVPLDGLSEAMRKNYFFARALIGRQFYTPAVSPRFAQALRGPR